MIRECRLGLLALTHFYTFFEINPEKKTINQLIVPDFGETEKDLNIDELLPRPEDLLITVHEHLSTLKDFLTSLPTLFPLQSSNPGRALGPAIKAATKLLAASGGRTTCFIGGIPTNGYGKLGHRDDSNRVDKSGRVPNLHSVTDIYKQIALECNGNQSNSIQMGIDTFFLAGQYSDISTVSSVSRWSSGSIFYYPALHHEHEKTMFEKLENDLHRYFTRKIGFEGVLRIRCTTGIKITQFHGNAFVRGEDILSLANINPDAGFAMNLELDEDIDRFPSAGFQAALLYTNSMGERRVRVHTLSIPVAKKLEDIYNSADGRSCVSLLSQMAVDRAVESSIGDARTALVNATVDAIKSFREMLPGSGNQVVLPLNLLPMPLFISSLLRHNSLTTRTPLGTDLLDSRVYAMCQLKQLPADQALLEMYPVLYRIDELDKQPLATDSESESQKNEDNSESSVEEWRHPDVLPLTAASLCGNGIFLMDCGSEIIVYVGQQVAVEAMQQMFGKTFPNELDEQGQQLPELETLLNTRLHEFIDTIQDPQFRSFISPVRIVRDDTSSRSIFINRLVQDRNAGGTSYYDFLMEVNNELNGS